MKRFLGGPLSNGATLLATVAIIAALVLAGSGAGAAPAPAVAPLGLTGGTSNITGNLAVAGNVNATGTVTAGTGQTITAGGLTVTAGNLTLSAGNARVSNFVIMDAATAISVTMSSTITPTASYQLLTSAGAVGATLAASGFTTGTVVTFENIVNQTITITDTSTTMLSGNIALGQYDTLTVLWDGTNWVQLATSNN